MASLWRLRHFLQIAESFYSLDNQGTGTINLKDCKCCGLIRFRRIRFPSNSWIHIAGANVARSCSWLHVRLAFPKSRLKWQGLLWHLVESQLYTNHFSSDVIFAGLSLAGRVSQCHWHLFVQEGSERESSLPSCWKLQVWRILLGILEIIQTLGTLNQNDALMPRVFCNLTLAGWRRPWQRRLGSLPGGVLSLGQWNTTCHTSPFQKAENGENCKRPPARMSDLNLTVKVLSR